MIKKLIFLSLILILLFFGLKYLIKPPTGITDQIEWGVAFSRPFAVDMGLDWKEAYLAILNDLKPKTIRLPIYWQDIEPQEGQYRFDEYDWMIKEARQRDIELLLVVGRKLPRWPECHIPTWAVIRDEKTQQERVMYLIAEIVKHYKDYPNLYAWQVENEPFLPFGMCPELDVDFLEREIALVKSLDNNHPVLLTDSGELSIWLRAAKRGDIFGTTMYRTVYHKYLGYIEYPLPPKFFWLKANLVRLFYPNKPIIVSELQAEPWGPKLLPELSLDEQERSMDLEKFRDTIEYAREVGFPKAYLWGTEWWYQMKNLPFEPKPQFWEEAKELLSQ